MQLATNNSARFTQNRDKSAWINHRNRDKSCKQAQYGTTLSVPNWFVPQKFNKVQIGAHRPGLLVRSPSELI